RRSSDLFGAGVELHGAAGFLWRDSSAWFLSGRVETQKAPAGDWPSRGCLIGECESPGKAVVRPQSRKWGSGGKAQTAGNECSFIVSPGEREVTPLLIGS